MSWPSRDEAIAISLQVRNIHTNLSMFKVIYNSQMLIVGNSRGSIIWAVKLPDATGLFPDSLDEQSR